MIKICSHCGEEWECRGCSQCRIDCYCVKCWAKKVNMTIKECHETHDGSCFPPELNKPWRIA